MIEDRVGGVREVDLNDGAAQVRGPEVALLVDVAGVVGGGLGGEGADRGEGATGANYD